MIRYLFLDIDGVLNSERTVIAYNKIVHSNLIKGRLDSNESLETMFDPIAVGLLAAAQKDLGFKIVISSTWRKHLSIQEFHRVFSDYGWDTTDIIIGKTGDDYGMRGSQIKSWLDLHNNSFEYDYCILDDSDDMRDYQKLHFIKINMEDGITFSNFKEIYEVFGESFNEGKILLP